MRQLKPVLTLLLVFATCGTTRISVCGQEVNYSTKPDIVYGHKDGMALTYDVFTPNEPNGVGLIFMVSGGWVSRWAPPEQTAVFFGNLLEKGYTVFALRHGSSPRYVIPEIAKDIKLAVQHIHEHASEHDVDPGRLGVFGASAGGHLSLLLATQTNDQGDEENAPRIRAVVAIFPPTDLAPYVEPGNPLRERFPALKFDPQDAHLYSPLHFVSADDAPTLLVHGDKDELVPIWHSQKIADQLKQAGVPVEMITIEGAGHGFDAQGMARMFESMGAWFDRYLLKSE